MSEAYKHSKYDIAFAVGFFAALSVAIMLGEKRDDGVGENLPAPPRSAREFTCIRAEKFDSRTVEVWMCGRSRPYE